MIPCIKNFLKKGLLAGVICMANKNPFATTVTLSQHQIWSAADKELIALVSQLSHRENLKLHPIFLGASFLEL